MPKNALCRRWKISKCEDLTSDKFSEVFGYIREMIEKANLFNRKENYNVKKD